MNKSIRSVMLFTGVALSMTLIAGAVSYGQPATKSIRYVVIHKPGPTWKAGVAAFEQSGLQQHVDHYRKLLESGKLMIGGPFMDPASGGMMIPVPEVPEEEMRKFAGDDPAVKSGLLTFEIRPWLAALQR